MSAFGRASTARMLMVPRWTSFLDSGQAIDGFSMTSPLSAICASHSNLAGALAVGVINAYNRLSIGARRSPVDE